MPNGDSAKKNEIEKQIGGVTAGCYIARTGCSFWAAENDYCQAGESLHGLRPLYIKIEQFLKQVSSFCQKWSSIFWFLKCRMQTLLCCIFALSVKIELIQNKAYPTCDI